MGKILKGRFMKVIAIIISIALEVVAGAWHTSILYEQQVSKAVMDVCSYSKSVQSGEAEHLCGVVQDSTGREFLCKDRKCIVERSN